MTTKEAIETLPVARLTIKGNPNVVDAEFNRYSEAIDLAINALEKQIPKKPTTDGYFKRCPVCTCEIILSLTDGGGIDYECDYCPECGQAIDWSEE